MFSFVFSKENFKECPKVPAMLHEVGVYKIKHKNKKHPADSVRQNGQKESGHRRRYKSEKLDPCFPGLSTLGFGEGGGGEGGGGEAGGREVVCVNTHRPSFEYDTSVAPPGLSICN